MENARAAAKAGRAERKKSPSQAKSDRPSLVSCFPLFRQRNPTAATTKGNTFSGGEGDSRSHEKAPRALFFHHPSALTGDNATSRVVHVGRRVLRGLGGRGQGGRSLIGRDSGERLPRGCLGDRPRGRGPPPASPEHAAALSRGRGRRRRARSHRESGDGTAPRSGTAAGLRGDEDAGRRRR